MINSFKEIISKTTVANISAFIIVVTGFLYGIYRGDMELVKNCLLLTLGYLFGKSVK